MLAAELEIKLQSCIGTVTVHVVTLLTSLITMLLATAGMYQGVALAVTNSKTMYNGKAVQTATRFLMAGSYHCRQATFRVGLRSRITFEEVQITLTHHNNYE